LSSREAGELQARVRDVAAVPFRAWTQDRVEHDHVHNSRLHTEASRYRKIPEDVEQRAGQGAGVHAPLAVRAVRAPVKVGTRRGQVAQFGCQCANCALHAARDGRRGGSVQTPAKLARHAGKAGDAPVHVHVDELQVVERRAVRKRPFQKELAQQNGHDTLPHDGPRPSLQRSCRVQSVQLHVDVCSTASCTCTAARTHTGTCTTTGT
jgi:hypothetical protein